MPTSTTDLKSKIQDDVPEVNVQNHLKVLGVFFHLLESAPKHYATDEQSLDEFFQRATYCLQLWVNKIIKIGDEEQPLQEHELPPLDVALALHSLMLSPHRYFEDSELRFRQLKRMKEYPLNMMVAAMGAGNTKYDEVKCHAALEYWCNRTGLAFGAVNSMNNDHMRSVICPSCQEAADVSWKGDRGFAGSDFKHQCRKCQMILTHDILRAGKFLLALNQTKHDPRICLPNTAVLVRGELDIQMRCPAIVDEVRKCLENPNGQLLSMGDMVNLAATESHSIMAYIAERLSRPESVLRVESIPMLLRAFDHSYSFTQDVVDALHHQHPFIRTIFHQGWSRPNSGGPSHDDLDIAYAQYGEFLQRIVTPNRREPEWKDDLIWHTHQLMPQQYRDNIVNYIRVFLDHLPRGEDLNGYRPQHDASKLAPVSIWVQGDPVFHTKGGVYYSPGPNPQHCSAAGCSCSSAGIVAHSFLKMEPVSDILSQ
ncbi:hypothetical protein BDN71DRAFT_1498568 [Pleurotus eryngii]|uniref:Uncharacterized protein n=1 Tax=Pleurotus eryngii TaxID=5323 RepID=A0A9P5ZQC4_PLEER|nr:hypothetical protein BDN71DRAFT_1498568 [Pleurotus eryngii]